MSHNLAARSPEERANVNMDLVASGVAYKERLDRRGFPPEVEREQLEALRDYFRERQQHYRNLALQFSRRTDLVFRKNQKLSDKLIS